MELPVRNGTVAALKVRRFPEAQTLCPDRRFVDLDAEPRQIADRIIGAVEPWLHREEIGIVEAQLYFGRPGLEPREVGYRGGEMNGRSRAHWTKRIVRHQIHIVRLAPACDFHRLGEPADIANIEPVKLVNPALDVRQELPLAGEFLA